MTETELMILKSQWLEINGASAESAGMKKGARVYYLKDNGNLIIKYVTMNPQQDKKDYIVEGVQFIISYDYGRDLYNVVVEKYRDTTILERKVLNGLYSDDLLASTLADFSC